MITVTHVQVVTAKCLSQTCLDYFIELCYASNLLTFLFPEHGWHGGLAGAVIVRRPNTEVVVSQSIDPLYLKRHTSHKSHLPI